jgi:hypothetical protein
VPVMVRFSGSIERDTISEFCDAVPIPDKKISIKPKRAMSPRPLKNAEKTRDRTLFSVLL